MDKEYLEKSQPILYKFFSNAKEKNKLPHLILLYSDPKANLLDLAMYIAKSIKCKQQTFSCNNCIDCEKFEKGIRPDFALIDGEKETIKKEDVDTLQQRFINGSIEVDQTVVYIINEISNITTEAANALLKFLEEPKANIVAILTSTNITKVMKTIVSRSTPIHIFIDKQIEEDLYNKTQNKLLSYILANISGNKETLNNYLEDEEIMDLYQATIKVVYTMQESFYKASFILLNEVATSFKGGKLANMFYKIFKISLLTCLDSTSENVFDIDKTNFIKNKNKVLEIINLLDDVISKSQANLSFIGVCGQINSILLKK